MSITGSRVEEPSRAGVSILDAGSGMWAAMGILTALYQRALTGKGQIVGTSLFETGIYWMNYHLTAYQFTHENPAPQAAGHMAFVPYGAFQTADDLLLIGVSNDSLFSKLVDVLGLIGLDDDPKFRNNVARVKHRDELEALLTKTFMKHKCKDWLHRLDEAGVPCSLIQRVSQVLQDKQVENLGLLKSMSNPLVPGLRIPVVPVRFGDSSMQIRLNPPRLGENSRDILDEIGVSDEAFQQLIQKGIVQ
jgi:crotonobetainyl-CoA:carnitine CoA-transferase CaiB-like acyl-CoA transferase